MTGKLPVGAIYQEAQWSGWNMQVLHGITLSHFTLQPFLVVDLLAAQGHQEVTDIRTEACLH